MSPDRKAFPVLSIIAELNGDGFQTYRVNHRISVSIAGSHNDICIILIGQIVKVRPVFQSQPHIDLLSQVLSDIFKRDKKISFLFCLSERRFLCCSMPRYPLSASRLLLSLCLPVRGSTRYYPCAMKCHPRLFRYFRRKNIISVYFISFFHHISIRRSSDIRKSGRRFCGFAREKPAIASIPASSAAILLFHCISTSS